MRKAGFSVARVFFWVLAASMLGVAMLASPASGQTSACLSSGKCFSVDVTPKKPVAGASTSFKFTIGNEASTQQLGSVKISAPTGFMITDAPGAASRTSSSALFLNLSLAPSATTTLTLILSATVSCSGGDYQWGIAAKQSNDFHGQGNDFLLDPLSAGNLSGTVTGSCSLHPCPSGAVCSASASSSSGTTSGTVMTSSPVPGDFITTEIGDFTYTCNGMRNAPVSAPFIFGLFDANGVPQSTITLTVSLEIDKSLVNVSGHPGASSWQICYASTSPFTPLPGTEGTATIGDVSYQTGLLPDCSGTPAPPCVQARHKDNAGDIVVTFLAPGDPIAHG